MRASAPGRCGIVGNPTDIYGGFVVSCSVPARATCELADGDALPEDRRLWDAALARVPLGRVEVRWSTEIPRSSGLSGSTALLASTLACVLARRGEPPALATVAERTTFAELVRDVELREAGIVCGHQDAQMIVHGGLQAMDFAGKHPLEPGPPPTLRALEAPLPFLLVTTGVERLSGSVHGPMRDRWLAGETEVVEAMARIADLGRAGAEAIEAGDWARLAPLMRENHARVAALGGSGDAIDALIAACERGGALAAKLAGAGLGGTVIALTETPDRLEASLRAEGYTRFLRPERVPGLRFED